MDQLQINREAIVAAGKAMAEFKTCYNGDRCGSATCSNYKRYLSGRFK